VKADDGALGLRTVIEQTGITLACDARIAAFQRLQPFDGGTSLSEAHAGPFGATSVVSSLLLSRA
jgi:hypothetical protein